VLELANGSDVDLVRRAQWHRKSGDACLGAGRIVEAKEHILQAMETLGYPLPASDAGLLFGILKAAARQAGHRLWHVRDRAGKLDGRNETIRLEYVILAEKLAVVQFLNGDPNPLPMLYAVITGLNVGETLPDTPELWTMYATMSAVMGFVPLHAAARYYKQRWVQMGEKIHDPNAYVDGAIALSTVASGNGAWREVGDLIEKAADICEEIGDHRRGAESVAYLSINSLLEGGPAMTALHNKRLWQIAMRRQNPIHIAFAYQNDCTALAWSGEYDACIDSAQKCLALSERSWVGDIPEFIVRSAMWLAMWRKGERDGVWENVTAALDKFARASIVDYSAYLIDSHLAEIAFLALEEGKRDGLGKPEMDAIESYARVAIKNLKKYHGVFAIGGPALNRYRGQLEWYRDRKEKAYQLWRLAAQQAHSFPIAYEAGWAELLLGQRLPEGDTQRLLHLQRAAQVFERAGLANWARVAGES
jgi:hypothetical protein